MKYFLAKLFQKTKLCHVCGRICLAHPQPLKHDVRNIVRRLVTHIIKLSVASVVELLYVLDVIRIQSLPTIKTCDVSKQLILFLENVLTAAQGLQDHCTKLARSLNRTCKITAQG